MTAAAAAADGVSAADGRAAPGRWRVGVDTGGTFADVVAYDVVSGTAHVRKVPSDAEPREMLEAALADAPVDAVSDVVHGTTRVTNAVLEGRVSRTALVATRGFGDVLVIARQSREHLYDPLRRARPAPIVPRELCFEVGERVGPDGAILTPLEPGEVETLVRALEDAEVEAVAVCLLHAYAEPRHEVALGAALRERWPVSLSHEVSAERREYERSSTTALNASVLEMTDRYLRQMQEAVADRFPRAALYIVQSTGGMVGTDLARALPLATVMSGPAAGVATAARLARRLSLDPCVSLDMGGTSTDASLIRGGAVAAGRGRKLAGHAVRMPAVDVESVATGGGSIVRVDDVGALRVGPRSAGATPGPACFDRGGTEPTVTDADVVLGLIDPARALSGVAVDPELARVSLEPVAERLEMEVEQAAAAVLEVAHAQMERALRVVSVQRGYDLSSCALIAFGGAGSVHAGPIAAAAGIRTVVVPHLAPVLSALGCCLSEVLRERVETELGPLDHDGVESARERLQGLVERESALLSGEQASGEDLMVSRYAELRYRGQNDELQVTWPAAATVEALRAGFREAHLREFGYVTDEEIEITAVGCRVAIGQELEWPSVDGLGGEEAAGEVELRLAGDRSVAAPVLSLGALADGKALDGPALVTSPLGSVTVWEGQTARADESGNVLLEAA